MADETTETLLIHWRSGDRDAGETLFRRYLPVLQGFFSRRASQHADDLVQRTLLACVQGANRFESRSSFRSYLFGIARNQFLMLRRAEAYSGHDPVTGSTRPEEGPSQLAALREEHVILARAMSGVEPQFSRVLRLFYWGERSVEEIAAELSVPSGTVKSRLARGRAALKANLFEMNLREGALDGALRELSRWFQARPV